jgi:hypothetical protein
MVTLSTDSPVDLSPYGDRLIGFSRELPSQVKTDRLANEHKWFVRSAHGCSCGFRHLHVSSVELGFAEPVDWFPEAADDIEPTGSSGSSRTTASCSGRTRMR